MDKYKRFTATQTVSLFILYWNTHIDRFCLFTVQTTKPLATIEFNKQYRITNHNDRTIKMRAYKMKMIENAIQLV